MKIVTHDGIFHADEVFAVATILFFQGLQIEDIEIVRTRDREIISEEQNQKDTFVLDVGNVYQTEMLNFDHHQSSDFRASNVLVLNYFKSQNKIDDFLFNELRPFYNGISDFDTNSNGIIQKFSTLNEAEEYRTVSNIISGFNRNPNDEQTQNEQFKKAVTFAKTILENEIHSAKERAKGMFIWYYGQKINDHKVILLDEFCSVWQREAKKTNIKFVIYPPNSNQWNLQSIDSNLYPLPSEEDMKSIVGDELVFAHKGKFVAGFKTKQAAIFIASELL